MNRCCALWLLLCGLLCSFSKPALGGVVQGIGVLSLGAWDFSASASVHPVLDPEADLAVATVVDPPLGERAWGLNGAELTIVSDSTFEELTTVPDDSSLYNWDQPALYDVVYVIRTKEGHYAKFKFIDLLWPTIEYAYQPNGLRVLVDTVPVEQKTWGKIKVLFR